MRELGTGWDRVVSLCEQNQLPSPEIIQYEDSTRVILYSHIDFSELTKEQKLWACYLHACILWGRRKSATNTTLRERFGVDKKSSSAISRLLKDAVARNLLKMKEESIGTKSNRYIPYWAWHPSNWLSRMEVSSWWNFWRQSRYLSWQIPSPAVRVYALRA